MKILEVQQGTPKWIAVRAKHFCASDAPAMMGVSKYTTREELLKRKATGIEPEVDSARQALYDRGHEAEALARPIVEVDLLEELYPAVITDDAGRLLASLDGVTMDGETGFEHKLWNEELAAQVAAHDLPPAIYWQLEHQALVAGLKRIRFVCSDGTAWKMVWTEYRPVKGRTKKLLAGWAQFEADLKAYQHVEVLPPAVAEPVMALPALSIQVQGSITLIDNLAVFGDRLKAFIAAIDQSPADDQAFANAEAACKTLQTAQDALQAAEASALAQTATIDEMRRTVALYRDLARTTRLSLEKLVAVRKETLREEIRQGGIDAFNAHMAGLNTRLGKPYMPAVPVDFAGAMKGKKTIASLRDAVAGELARAKIEANEVADRIGLNLTTLRELAADHAFLFADTPTIVQKATDDLTMLVKVRISEHKIAEEKRLEVERERIRAEERAKAEAEQTRILRAEAAKAEVIRATVMREEQTEATRGIAPAEQSQVFGMPQTTPWRPTDEAIIHVLVTAYQQPEDVIIGWLLEMNIGDPQGVRARR